MRKPKPAKIMEKAFAAISDDSSCVSGRLRSRVQDCILDYVPAARARGLSYFPVIFGLKSKGEEGMGLIACSEAIKRLEPDGLRFNDDSYPSLDALMVAAELNRIFEKVQKDL